MTSKARATPGIDDDRQRELERITRRTEQVLARTRPADDAEAQRIMRRTDRFLGLRASGR